MLLEPGQSLSHYKLLEKIGEGGMGVVWKAEDTVLGRTVAVKVLPAGLSSDEERRRMFFQEAKAASSVSTAHIVQVYEFGREGELDFLVMEYVEGNPLSKLLHGRPLSPRKVAALGAQIARGLAKAHRAKLVHRDLKPGNLLVTPDGEVKIVDFGLATLCQRMDTLMLEEMTTRSVMGESGEKQPRRLAGTLPYMSPEQVRLEKLDGRSDIFSLGTILYEMTTGQLPFQGATHSEVMREVLKARPEPAHDLVPSVPLELDRILTKAMALHVEERYQDAETLAVDLTRLGKELESGTSPSYADLQTELAPGRRVTRRAWAFIGAMTLAVVVIAVWRAISGMAPSADPRTVMILPLEVRGQDVGADYLGRQFAEWVAVDLAFRSENLKVLPVTEAGEPGAGPEARARWARELGAGRLLTGALTRDGEVVRASLSLVDTSANRVLWGIDRETTGDDLMRLPPKLAREVGAAMGAVEKKLYDWPGARTRNPELAQSPLYLEVMMASRRWKVLPMETMESLIAAFPGETEALMVAVDCFRNRGLFKKDEEAFRRLDETLAEVMRLDPDAPWEDGYRAWYLEVTGDLPGAMEIHNLLLDRDDLAPSLRGSHLAQRGYTHGRLGNREARLRDYEEAVHLGSPNWDVLTAYASALLEEWRLEEGIEQLRRAMAVDPFGPGVVGFLGELLFHLERWDEVRILETLCEGERAFQEGCAQYAYSLHRTGHPEEARHAAEVAETLEDGVDGPWVLANYWALAGDAARAVRLLRREAEVNSKPLLLRGHHDLDSLRGNPEFEALAAEQWSEALGHYGERCTSEPGRVVCALHAVALHLAGQESEAQEAEEKAASLEENVSGSTDDWDALAWYHALTANREEVIRLLWRHSEVQKGPMIVPGAAGASHTAWKLQEHRDYAWLVGDPEFDAFVTRSQDPGP